MEEIDKNTRRSGAPSRPYWLIVDQEGTGGMKVLTVDLCAHGEALAVFSFEEEARMYLRLRMGRPGWRVRQTSVGELVSVLCGPCADTKRVVLDPLPERGGEELAGLLSMGREDFLQTLMSEVTAFRQPAWLRSEASPKLVTGVA